MARRGLRRLALIAACTVALAGCGGGAGSNGGPTGQDSGGGPQGKVTLWMFPVIEDSAQNDAFWQQAKTDFEAANPGIDVTVETIPWVDRETKIATAFASGTGMDLVLLIADQIPQFVEQGFIAPLDDVLESSKDAIRPSVLDAVSLDGSAYAVPLYLTTNVPIYNKALFEAAGITQMPRTWADIKDAAPALAAQGIPVLDYPAASKVTLNVSFYPLLWQAGGRVFSEDGTRAAFNGPEGIEAVQFLLDLQRMGGLPDNVVAEANAIEGSRLAAGKAGMMLMAAPAAVGQLGAAIGAGNVVLGPPIRNKEQVTYGVPGGIVLSAQSKNQEAAKKFLEYLGSVQVVKAFCEASGYFSPRTDAEPNLSGVAPEFAESLEYAFPGEPNPKARQAMSVIAPYLQQALQGTTDAQSALDSAAEEVNALLAAG